ncbi:MAG TPA: VWA domain-containing protein [Pyrinomonadaceae bacterium]|nr:VWA domain-containing protein [Pyrinomonadaceae bacterium]
MQQDSLAKTLRLILIIASIFVCAYPTPAQQRCLTPEEIRKIIEQAAGSANVTLNKKLRDQLLKLKENAQQRLDEDLSGNKKPEALIKRMREFRDKNTARLCAIVKQYGWPTAALVGHDGVDAAFYLLRNGSTGSLKVDLIPAIVAAVTRGDIARPEFAGFVDRLRLESGLKQLFGTQATIRDGLLVLFPIEAERDVDARRKQYELPLLADYLQFLEAKYRLPLIRSTGTLTNQFSEQQKTSIATTTSAGLLEGQTVDENEVVRVDTNLVSLNVSVYSKTLKTHIGALGQKDFSVSEDGQEQAITYFATTDVPFDLVLLIDLSGSTARKRKLIRESTQRFIQATRPADRVAIVTFSTTTNVMSPLTDDRAALVASSNLIGEEVGESHVWDALKFTLDKVIGPKTLERRRAVVFMTDGVDNALLGGPMRRHRGSTISFGDLLEAVRRNDTLIIPIYLDTENDEYSNSFTERTYENARKTLALLADESGGLYYKAKKIEDLEGAYGQVIEDLGKVYSLGYKPTNDKRDGRWRTVKIQLPNLPDLSARTRPGYYAN